MKETLFKDYFSEKTTVTYTVENHSLRKNSVALILIRAWLCSKSDNALILILGYQFERIEFYFKTFIYYLKKKTTNYTLMCNLKILNIIQLNLFIN